MKSIALLVSLIASCICYAQTEKGVLIQNKLQASELSEGEVHIYTIPSDGDQFMVLTLDQIGIDVNISVNSPSGVRVAYFDSPNGKNGPENMTLVTKVQGDFTFEISPYTENPEAGKYTIELLKLEPLGKTPEEKIDQLMCLYSSETAGASIAVLHEGEVVFSKGYGQANLEYDIPVDNKTIFHVASVSKQFTAFAILLLEEDGKLEVDDDIRKYIPEVPDFGHTITLRQLANHTSGLRDQWNLLIMAGWLMDDVITKDQVLKLISRQEALNFNPDDEHLYCNTGFTLLAEVVSRVSGKTFDEFCQERIFLPLGMDNTLFYEDHERIVKNRAYSYQKSGNGYKKSVLSYAIAGATSLFTTPEDLTKWSANFLQPAIGNEKTMSTMHTEDILNDGSTYGYAFGQSIEPYNGLINYSHGGADAGFRTYLTRFPNEQLTVAVFGNEGGFNASKVAHDIVEIYIGSSFERIEEKVEVFDATVESEITTNGVDASVLENYLGEYELQPGYNIAISIDGDDLKGRATGQVQFDLTPESDTLFVIPDSDTKISFPADLKGPAPRLLVYQGEILNLAKRVTPFDKSAIDLTEYAGTFHSDELATDYRIDLVNDTLIVSHSKYSDSRLDPIKPDLFTCTYWALGSLEFVRNEANEIVGMKASNGRVRNVFFEKEEG